MAGKLKGRYNTRKIAKLDYAAVNKNGLVRKNVGNDEVSAKMAKLDSSAAKENKNGFVNGERQPSVSAIATSVQVDDVKRKDSKYRVKELTERRKELIASYLQMTAEELQLCGKLGSEQWTNNLIDNLGERNKRHRSTPFDVRSWLTDTDFFKEHLEKSLDWTPKCWLMSVTAPGSTSAVNEASSSAAEKIDVAPSSPVSTTQQKEKVSSEAEAISTETEKPPPETVNEEDHFPSTTTTFDEDHHSTSTVEDDDQARTTDEDQEYDGDESCSTEDGDQELDDASVSPSSLPKNNGRNAIPV